MKNWIWMRKKIAVLLVLTKTLYMRMGANIVAIMKKWLSGGNRGVGSGNGGGGWMGDLGLVANTRRHSLEGQLRPLVLPALCSGLVALPSFIEEHRWAIGATLIVSVAAGALIYNWICVSRIFSGEYDHCCVLSVVLTTINFTNYML